MSKGLQILLARAAVAACAGSLWIGSVQAQQVQQKGPQQLPQQDLQQMWEAQKSQMRARLAGASQQLQAACGEELRNFCGTVTPGEGRLLLCMQAHEDKLGRQCEMALLEVSRGIGNAVRRVERFAEACWQDIKTLCSGAGGSIAQCVIDNRASLSPQCQAIDTAAQPGVRQGQVQQPTMAGLAIFSSDGMKLGEVTGVKRRPDGSIEAIEADMGAPLGMGARAVLISPSELQWKGDHIELQLAAEQVRSILQGQRR